MTMLAEIETLIRRVARGDRAAFARLYRATAGRLLGVVSRVLPDADLAQEALRATYVMAWQSAGKFADSDLSAWTWLTAMARHIAVEVRRKHAGGDVVAGDLVACAYWGGGTYDDLARARCCDADDLRVQMRGALRALQQRLTP